MSRENEAVSLRRIACALLLALWAGGCDQLGNPKQFATGPTRWKDQHGHLVTTTRSFKDEKTIRRLLAEGIENLDYTDPSIGPSEALTVVVVVPQAFRRPRRGKVKLVTIFKLADRAPITRRWSAPVEAHKWSAAFALPQPPLDAVTSVAP
jgi:hypothetical protein